jgi:hypothetical protein
MTANVPPQQGRGEGPRLTSRARRLAHRVAAVISECHYAQRRWVQLMMSPDSYLMEPNRAPDTYAAFLYRTSGGLWHEPSARERQEARWRDRKSKAFG